MESQKGATSFSHHEKHRTNTHQPFKFFPRPEAHAMKWEELLPPLRQAVRDLLLRLDGAVADVCEGPTCKERDERSKKGDRGITGNCFLIFGERGTGKSTVLLSAREAVTPNSDFFDVKENQKNAKDESLRLNAKQSADRLEQRRIVWLDVLDLESLPPHANLLTTMLTRLYHAMYTSKEGSESGEITSILEERAESGRHKLNQLINDATFMWEDIRERETRDMATRQVFAAKIYTEFRDRFQDAMNVVAKEVGRQWGDKTEHHPIVLPIDNIDRSTDHLHSIVKLAQLVACPHLWLVMAGDREDVDILLERAYWKELIMLGEGEGAGVGKEATGHEDEALVMARRQAAAASHRLLPPSHRIEIKLVKPAETLLFSRPMAHGPQPSIYQLLEQIEVPNLGTSTFRLVELFDAGKRAEGSFSDEERRRTVSLLDEEKLPKYLTQSAQLGLHLSARGVLDLWQLAYWVVNDPGSFTPDTSESQEDDPRAEKIARTMLRNVITESKMPSEMGRRLLDTVIHREPNGTTILNFREPNPSLKVDRLRALEFERRLHPALLTLQNKNEESHAVRSVLQAMGTEEVLMVTLASTSKAADGQSCKGKNETAGELPELPHLVAGWLAVLHDIVIRAKRSWVVDSPFHHTAPRYIQTIHHVALMSGKELGKEPERLIWPAPRWETFLAYDVFWMRWVAFWSPLFGENKEACPAQYAAWTLAIGWVSSVIDTFAALAPNKQQPKTDLSGTVREKFKSATPGSYKNVLIQCEKTVLLAAADCYAMLSVKDGEEEGVFLKSSAVTHMRDWLELKLPLLLGHLYVPLSEKVHRERVQNLVAVLHAERGTGGEVGRRKAEKQLVKAWSRNREFILAEYRTRLVAVFQSGEKAEKGEEGTKAAQGKPPYLSDLELLGPFADLFSLLPPPPPAT